MTNKFAFVKELNSLVKMAGKIAYEHGEYYMRGIPIPGVDFDVEESKEPEETSKDKKKKGPPVMWDEYLRARWSGGKKKVSNPNPDTRDKFKQVTMSTAMKYPAFAKNVMKDYYDWVSKTNKDIQQKDMKPKSDEKPKDKIKDNHKDLKFDKGQNTHMNRLGENLSPNYIENSRRANR